MTQTVFYFLYKKKKEKKTHNSHNLQETLAWAQMEYLHRRERMFMDEHVD